MSARTKEAIQNFIDGTWGAWDVSVLRKFLSDSQNQEADARRYRWIIEKSWFQREADFRLGIDPTFPHEYGPAIDEAMRQEAE